MDWYKSFIIKDALTLLSRVSRWELNPEYTTSFRPEELKRLVDVMLDCPERPKDFTFSVKEPEREYDHICLTSGGADSTIAWYWAGKPQGLYIDIGQSYARKEMKALEQLAIPYKYIDLRGTHLAEKGWKHIIPGRNFLFLCIAAELVNGNIWFAMVEGEGAESDKGDKSLVFVDLFEDWYQACTGRGIYVQTMVANTKPGWLKWFKDRYDINIIRHNTVTCFSEQEGQCGTCQSCLRKYLSFKCIGMNISEDFVVHPMVGAKQYVDKYNIVLKEALEKQDFTHYSRRRCVEDLFALDEANQVI